MEAFIRELFMESTYTVERVRYRCRPIPALEDTAWQVIACVEYPVMPDGVV